MYLVFGCGDVTAWFTASVDHTGSKPKSFPLTEALSMVLKAGGYSSCKEISLKIEYVTLRLTWTTQNLPFAPLSLLNEVFESSWVLP